MALDAVALATAPPPMAQEGFAGLPPVPLERPTSIADQQTKQLALLSATGLAVRRESLLAGADYYYRDRYGLLGQKLKPAVFVEYDNQGAWASPCPPGWCACTPKSTQGAASPFWVKTASSTPPKTRLCACGWGKRSMPPPTACRPPVQKTQRYQHRNRLPHRTAQRQGRSRDGARARTYTGGLGNCCNKVSPAAKRRPTWRNGT